jgi:formamidopyrimidine-DNA glycosylase
MPELPEVEIIKRSLQKAIVGKKIVDIEVRKAKIFQGDTKEVIGKTIEKVERRGKILIIQLSGGKNLLVHFKLTGQMVWAPRAGESVMVGHPILFAGTKLPAKTTHVIFEIDDPPSHKASARQSGKLFYNDLRQFGWIKVVESSKLKVQSEVAKLGVEPFDKEFTVDYLTRVFSKTSRPIKLILMDQEKIAGVGNIYANDALFEAGILPAKPAKKLNNLEIEKLRKAVIKVLEDGLKFGGSSAADEAYIKPSGEKGEYQEHFRVYQRDGEKCRKCDGVIRRINLGGRGTFWCPKCQR